MSAQSVDWIRTLIIPVAILLGVITGSWRTLAQIFAGMRARDWPTVSAVIDVVSVVQQTQQGRYEEQVVGYLATLTYFYRNPDLQMGEYRRMFGLEADAQKWAETYKGRTVLVHIDPRDPTRSVLRKEQL